MTTSAIGLLCCPLTASPLRPLTREQLAEINRRIAAGDVVSRNGTAIARPLDSGLQNESGSLIIPVRQGIVQMTDEHLIEG